jgi:hypothetical protein
MNTLRLLALVASFVFLSSAPRADIAPFPREVPGRHVLFFENVKDYPDYAFFVASPSVTAGYVLVGPIRVPDYRTIEVSMLNRIVRDAGIYLYAFPRSMLAGDRIPDKALFTGVNPPVLCSARLVDPELDRPSDAEDLITMYRVKIDGGKLVASTVDPSKLPADVPRLPPRAGGGFPALTFALVASGLGLCLCGFGLVLVRRRKAAAA